MTNPTSNFGWQMPTSTDLVTDLPADFEVFGQAVDTSLADLKGGTTGQILSKATNADMDFTWITNDVGDITAVTAGTGISGGGSSGAVTITNSMATEIAAKGDLIVGTGSQTFDNLTAGANGTVLTADSSTATGLKWAAAASGTTFSGASLTDASAISIPTSTFTRLTYTTEQYDTDSYHSNSTNTSRITIPSGKTGYYQVNAQVVYNASSGGGMRGLYIYLNGSSTFGSPDISAPSGQYPGVALTWNAYLTAGDYVELYAYQTSGGNLNCFVDATQARFQINYLGA